MNTKEHHLHEVDHSYVRYSNVWEDPNILIEGLAIQSDHKVLSIASAGDNAFALLAQGPKLLVAIDLNQVQLYLMELKKVAIHELDHKDFIAFLGYRENKDRWQTYLNISSQLSSNAKEYWDNRKKEINEGVIYCGKFEKYLKTFATKFLPFIHSKKQIAELFNQKSEQEQREFYNTVWNNWRWKLMFKFFFSKIIMGFFGRDPAFLAEVKVNVGNTIMEKAAIHLKSTYAQNNPILFYCLNGHFDSYLPYYAKEVNYKKVKLNLKNLHIEYGYAQEAVHKYGKFDRFNLSNIFEYMNTEIFEMTSKALINGGNHHSRFAYWNLMVKREISSLEPKLVRFSDDKNWAKRDQGFFYMQYIVEELKHQ